jgi:2,3-bisphosphoglycerate-independent phosphoglycerate mutase
MPGRRLLKNLNFITFIMQGADKNVCRPFQAGSASNPISKIWSDHGLKQFHIAESEKFMHVTYFFDGGREEKFPGEDVYKVASDKKVKTYDLNPKMSAEKVTDKLIDEIRRGNYDCYVVNYANTDMVGHTGNLDAAVKAVEFVDKCLGRLVPELLDKNGTAFIFADHGNVEQMVNPRTGGPDTEHTTNPVPFIIVSDEEKIKSLKLADGGILASIAPTVLEIMGLDFDTSQKEKSLIIHE